MDALIPGQVRRGNIRLILCFVVLLCQCGSVAAQLTECDQLNASGLVNSPGACIARSLRDQIGPGQGDVDTFGSSIYLIKRDPARSIRRGRQLFQRKFSAEEGHGPRVNYSSAGDVMTNRAFGAGLADSCAACHGRPRGAAGFGGVVNTRPDSRDAPHLFGLGIVEQLADEMTTRLRKIRSQAISAAKSQHDQDKSGANDAGFSAMLRNSIGLHESRRAVTRKLIAKGVDFGVITANADGTVDTSGVTGVDADLRVRPFFHHGGTASIREFIVGAFKDEMGLQSVDPILCSVTDPINPGAMVSPSGFRYDPATDKFDRPPACDVVDDPDSDGVSNEIDASIVDHMEFYLLNYFKPAQYKTTKRTRQGRRLMQEIGCTGCHKQRLVIQHDRRVADVETVYDPNNGIFNELFATATLQLGAPIEDGDSYPQLLPEEQRFVVENFFSDLKRHDLGPAFHEREFDDAGSNGANRVSEFVTEPLWGAGSTPPYGHDGRSINLDAVIRRHGGEAQPVTDAYLALGENRQRKIIDFLQTLVLFPSADTASNLSPGNTHTADPQSPLEHGAIDLDVLFQIPSLGRE